MFVATLYISLYTTDCVFLTVTGQGDSALALIMGDGRLVISTPPSCIR